MSQEPNLNEIIERLETVEHELGIYYPPDTNLTLEEIIEDLDTYTLQEILRNVNYLDLVDAVIGFKPKALNNLKSALSKNGWKDFVEDFRNKFQTEFNVFWLPRSRKNILGVINQLMDECKIVVVLDKTEYKAPSTEEVKKIKEENKKRAEEIKTLNLKEFKKLEAWKMEVFDTLDKA